MRPPIPQFVHSNGSGLMGCTIITSGVKHRNRFHTCYLFVDLIHIIYLFICVGGGGGGGGWGVGGGWVWGGGGGGVYKWHNKSPRISVFKWRNTNHLAWPDEQWTVWMMHLTDFRWITLWVPSHTTFPFHPYHHGLILWAAAHLFTNVPYLWGVVEGLRVVRSCIHS